MDKNNNENTFSDILLAEKKYNKSLTNEIANELESKGISITVRTIQMYKKGTLVPDYNLAKEILNILGISMTEEELLAVLNQSRIQKENLKENEIQKIIDPSLIGLDTAKLRKRISISSDNFTFLDGSGLPKSDAIDLIEQHVREIYGDDKYAFNRYICQLIDEDMKQ